MEQNKNVKRIVATNSKPQAMCPGIIVAFEKAKTIHNKVKLSDYYQVVLTFSEN